MLLDIGVAAGRGPLGAIREVGKQLTAVVRGCRIEILGRTIRGSSRIDDVIVVRTEGSTGQLRIRFGGGIRGGIEGNLDGGLVLYDFRCEAGNGGQQYGCTREKRKKETFHMGGCLMVILFVRKSHAIHVSF